MFSSSKLIFCLNMKNKIYQLMSLGMLGIIAIGCNESKSVQGIVSNNAYQSFEAGKNKNPTLDTLKKIAKALDISIDELVKK